MDRLILCSGCLRHFRASDAACPFCGARSPNEGPRTFAPIGAGASRSRRYALRAALLAGSATTACGQTSGDAGASQAGNSGLRDASTGAGGKNGAGGTFQGGSSGAATGGAIGGAGGLGGSKASGGNSGSGNGGAGGGTLVPGRACPGYGDDDPARFCRAPADCPARSGYTAQCVNALRGATTCPVPNAVPVQECGPSAPCPTDWACETLDACKISLCRLTAPCTDQNCNGDRSCVNGACVRIPCDQPGGQKCPARYECVPNAAPGEPWCRPAACQADGDCTPPLMCGGGYPDVHGCGGVLCERDGECACGYCVNRLCAPQLGLCDYQILAMPYGCVWPDEELV